MVQHWRGGGNPPIRMMGEWVQELSPDNNEVPDVLSMGSDYNASEAQDPLAQDPIQQDPIPQDPTHQEPAQPESVQDNLTLDEQLAAVI